MVNNLGEIPEEKSLQDYKIGATVGQGMSLRLDRGGRRCMHVLHPLCTAAVDAALEMRCRPWREFWGESVVVSGLP